MAETWLDRALDRAKDIPGIGRAAEWMADRRATAQRWENFWDAHDGSISTHIANEQLKVWRDALPTEQERQDRIWNDPKAVADHAEWMTKVVAENDRLDRINGVPGELSPKERSAEVYGTDITDPLTGKEYMIEAAATRDGFAYQVQEYGSEQVLHRGTSERLDFALNEARLWTETNILAESRTEYQIQEMIDRPFDLHSWEREGQRNYLSERRQAGIDAQERPRTMRGEIAHTLQGAADARSWTKSSWAKTPEDRAEIVAIAKKDIAHARELNNLSRDVPTQAVQRTHDVGISR